MPSPAVRRLLATFVVLLQANIAHPAGTLLLPVVDSPSGSGSSVVLEPARQRTQPTRRLVYSCILLGQLTFSDRPCGPAPVVRELKVTTPAPTASGGAPDLARDRPIKQTHGRPADASGGRDAIPTVDAHASACQKLQATLDDVDERMRAGYPAREAGKLWQRWREAKARLRAANC